MNADNLKAGHRDRLRQRYLDDPTAISENELLELLLTYAIPRRDVAPLANELIQRYKTIANLISTPANVLNDIPGLGEYTVTLLKLISTIAMKDISDMNYQPNLFDVSTKKPVTKKGREIRVFANDEIVTSLEHLPKAGDYSSYALYKDYLGSHLPYNSIETRQRRANYILDRFYPDEDLDTPLTLFTKYCKSQDSLKPVIFYHLAKAELLLAKVAEDLIFPALPLGKIGREQLREFILGYLPKIGNSSQKNALRSIFYSYTLLGVGREDGETLKFQLHPGNLDALVYVLSSEFPEPGIYSFDSLFDSPVHHWLLWDKDWIRKQLYLLRDMGVVSKVSEIDAVRQFSLEFGQGDCLNRYFNASGLSNPIDTMAGDKEL